MTKHIIFFMMFSAVTFCQTFLSGFEKYIDGPEIEYQSPHPEAKKALISRATDGNMLISWLTSPIPEIKNDTLTFIWLAGLGCNLGVMPFTFYINDDSVFTFYNWDKDKWIINGKNCTLIFNTILVDRYSDRMGIMVLKVPSRNYTEGESLRLAIRGHKMDSRAWVMTFEYKLKNELLIKTIPALVNIDNKLKHPIKVTYVNLNEKTPISIICLNEKLDTTANYGINHYTLYLSPANKEVEREIKLISDKKIFKQKFKQQKVKQLEIFLVQHTHTDIGYTRSQKEILEEHLRYIDYALDYCDITDSYPDDAKFHWTCEASYPVVEYLLSRPSETIERLKRRVKEGRIEITALPFNLGEILDENILVSSLQPLKVIKEKGFEIKTAMQNDVNGISLAYVDYLSDIGIKYVLMGQNPGHALRPFNYPTPFYWKTRSGKKLLAFRADHYMSANFVSNPSKDMKAVEEDLFNYIEQLINSGYPFDEVEMQFSGYHTDNSPPSTISSDIVAQWNKKYAWPHLKLSTISEFLNVIEKKYSAKINEYEKAWLDWWSDGFGSAPRETAIAAKTQKLLLATQGLLSLAYLQNIVIPQDLLTELNDIQKQLLFYGEHTFGAAESISEPLSKNSFEQWLTKSSFIWQAQLRSYLLKQKALGLFLPLLKKSENPQIYVFNTTNHKQTALVELFIDKQFLPLNKPFVLVDQNEKIVKAELLNQRPEGSYISILAEDVPPFSWKSYTLKLLSDSIKIDIRVDSTYVLENKFYLIELDNTKGFVKRLIDKELKINLVDDNSLWGFGEFIKETLSDRSSLELLKIGKFNRTSLKLINVDNVEKNSLWNKIKINGKTEEDENVSIEIRLFNTKKRIDFVYQIEKKRKFDPEAIYISFPFKLEKGIINFNLQGTTIRSCIDQLPGTSNDWNLVQDFVAIRNNSNQILLSSPDCPLMQFGNINTGRFKHDSKPETTHIFAWPFNNYWNTNFKAWEEGYLSWQFSITSSNDISDEFAEYFAKKVQLPMLTLVLPPISQEQNNKLIQNHRIIDDVLNFLNINNVIIPHINTDRDEGLFMLIREIGGKQTSIHIPEHYEVFSSNVLHEKKERVTKINLSPYEAKFYLLKKVRAN